MSDKKDTFNWKGIKDNHDGTFDVSDKRNKNRLIKEFRRQGVRARSTQIGAGRHYVYPVGKVKTRIRKPAWTYPGRKPRTRMRMGARPQVREQPGFFAAPPRRISPQYPGRRYHGRSNLSGKVGNAIKTWAGNRAQKNKEETRSPYTEEGKPREGYKTYTDSTGTQRIVREKPKGVRERLFPAKERQDALHQARVQESLKIEKDMANRSGPSTRVSEPAAPRTVNISPPRKTSTPKLTSMQGPTGPGGRNVSYPGLAEPAAPKKEPEKTTTSPELAAARVNAIEQR